MPCRLKIVIKQCILSFSSHRLPIYIKIDKNINMNLFSILLIVLLGLLKSSTTSMFSSSSASERSSKCFVPGKCLQSPLIGTSIQETENDCLKECQLKPDDDTWFTYFPSKKRCLLMEGCKSLVADEDCENCVSGEKSCQPHICNDIGLCQVT